MNYNKIIETLNKYKKKTLANSEDDISFSNAINIIKLLSDSNYDDYIDTLNNFKTITSSDWSESGNKLQIAMLKAIDALKFKERLFNNAKLLMSSDYDSREVKLFWADLVDFCSDINI